MSGSSVVEDRSRARRAKSALAGELRWERVLPSLAAGWIVGLMQLVLALSLGALIFAGEPPHFLAAGIGLALLASIIAGVITSLFTSLPGAVAGVQDVPAAILALIAASLLRNLPPDAGATEKFVTVAAVMGLSALLTGLFFWILGRFRLGRLVRFLPYPVVGGFLAATGWLLATGAIGLMSGAPFGTASFQPQLLLRWLPGLLIAVVLFVVLNRSDHALAIPATLAAATGLFFTTALFSGTTPGELSAAGWLLGPFPDGGLWQPLLPADLGSVRWEAVGGSAISIAAILLMSAVGLLLNGTGLEIATRRDVDLNRELKLAGVANMISGLAGGLVTYHLLSVSMISFKLKAANRLTGLVGAGVCALALTVGASGLALFPRAVLGGLLLFLGLSFLKEWVVDAWFRLPRGDYFVVILILLLAAAMGFLEAVGLGIVAAVVLFVINYSRTDVVRHKLSGASQQSRVTRPLQEQKLLRQYGEELFILRLQGYVFFGTADNLLDTVRERLADNNLPPPRYTILDFRRVTEIDSTASLSFRKLEQLAESSDMTLVFTELSPGIQQRLEQAGLADRERIHVFADLDRGLAWAEEQLLAAKGISPKASSNLAQQLATLLADEERAERLLPYLRRQEVTAGECLIRQGERPDALYFVEAGQVTAQLERPGEKPIRLQTMRGGHVIGEIGFYLRQERTAAVVADEASVIYSLPLEALQRMEREDPVTASTLHQLIARLLAERVTHLVRTVDALQR